MSVEPLTPRGYALLTLAGVILSIAPPRIVYPRPKRRLTQVWKARWAVELRLKQAFGQCAQYGCPCAVTPGRKLCQAHLTKQNEYARKSRAMALSRLTPIGSPVLLSS